MEIIKKLFNEKNAKFAKLWKKIEMKYLDKKLPEKSWEKIEWNKIGNWWKKSECVGTIDTKLNHCIKYKNINVYKKCLSLKFNQSWPSTYQIFEWFFEM
jgi:hypothetical protein